MAAQHPEYLEAIHRNIQLLKKTTSEGLLYGGMHYRVSGIAPCIHHTFGHAKAITSFLELPPLNITSSQELPRDKTYGLKYFKDIHTWLISQGPWRAHSPDMMQNIKLKVLIRWEAHSLCYGIHRQDLFLPLQ